MKTDHLTLWVLYNSPLDFPGQFVIRGQDVLFTSDPKTNGAIRPHAECIVGPDAASVEAEFKRQHPGKHWLPRHPGDEPQIVGSWV